MKRINFVAALILICASSSAFAWKYQESTDRMRGTKTKFAVTTSTNTANFDFPYAGGSRLNLTVRNRETDGLSVILTISKGQFVCFMGCAISAKFDDDAIVSFQASGSSDGSSDTIFIGDESVVLEKLRGAKRVIIEADFYDYGAKQFSFNVKGLKWN